jgi:hypothetical protein
VRRLKRICGTAAIAWLSMSRRCLPAMTIDTCTCFVVLVLYPMTHVQTDADLWHCPQCVNRGKVNLATRAEHFRANAVSHRGITRSYQSCNQGSKERICVLMKAVAANYDIS